MSGAPGLLELIAATAARVLSFGAPATSRADGQETSAVEVRQTRTPAWPDEPEVSDREQEERVRELQILMATWM
jgi:hypothetical protein